MRSSSFKVWWISQNPNPCFLEMTETISRLSFFSVANQSLRSRHPSLLSSSRPFLRFPQLATGLSLERCSLDSNSRVKLSTYVACASKYQEGTIDSYKVTEESNDGKLGTSQPASEETVGEKKRAAKIHDFCFGIPFGALVLSGGLLSFIFVRNPATLSNMILGGALLALSTFSLKIWRQGKSSTPFILGQSVATAAVFWNYNQNYVLTKKIFPTGFFAVMSVAMLCFYSYVMISGGNPPPKKSKPSPSVVA